MIIACPECAGPFELADDNVAAMVQLECPHCAFRMILDFAAANDPSLIETGMQMASGFRSTADYRAAVAGPSASEPSARPHLEAVPADEPAAAEVAPAPEPAAAPEPEPVADEPAATPEPEPEPIAVTPEPSAPAQDEFDDGPTMISAARRPPSAPAAEAPPAQPPTPARSETAIGPPPGPPRGETVIGPPPGPPEDVRIDADALAGDEDDAVTMIRTREEIAEARKAPHTPPGTPAAKPDEDAAPARPKAEGSQRVEIKRKRPAVTEGDKPERKPRPRFESQLPVADESSGSSMFGTAVVVILALLAIGLVGASVMQENTPDPRPLLEKLYRQYAK